MNAKKQIKRIEANAGALIIRAYLSKADGEDITIGQIRNMLMQEPYNMTWGDAENDLNDVKGLVLKGGEGDEAIISGIKIPQFSSVKKVLNRDFKISDLLPENILSQLKDLSIQGKIAGLVQIMDRGEGFWLYQDQVFELLTSKRFKLKKQQIASAISQAFSVNGYLSKPFTQKGMDVILAPGETLSTEIEDIIAFYDKETKKLFRASAAPKEPPVALYSAEIHTDSLSLTATNTEGEYIIKVIPGKDSSDKVGEIIRDFISELNKA
ncbi:MAG: hypothetical protein Q7S53_02895 [bacterium]|nr:hypothetical protein [bacterium]